ncbi:DUF4328 domain-containing protein [Myroides sp. M-43]|uniref:DUF4328 domain-containing protein n=1 Tax=Myroides oncorhynchi TaxID=2893756 RepID=UPI001E62FF3C|nr:DUF4328 domain-containing protein [Myroides oncorhynchi]MCC9044460.1 DUF4328 domain-containing protein [Myroides oncorhynchi]
MEIIKKHKDSMLLSNVSRGNALAVAIKMLIISSVASLNCLLIQYVIYKNANEGVHYINRDLMKFETINYIVTLFNIVASLFFLIVLIVWFFRAYSNMQSVDSRLTDSKYWILLGWLVPIFNFIMPYRLLNKMTICAVLYIKKSTAIQLKRFKSYWILLIWISFILIYFMRMYQYRIMAIADVMYTIKLGVLIHGVILTTILLFASYFNFYRNLEALIYKKELENSGDSTDYIELVRE